MKRRVNSKVFVKNILRKYLVKSFWTVKYAAWSVLKSMLDALLLIYSWANCDNYLESGPLQRVA